MNRLNNKENNVLYLLIYNRQSFSLPPPLHVPRLHTYRCIPRNTLTKKIISIWVSFTQFLSALTLNVRKYLYRLVKHATLIERVEIFQCAAVAVMNSRILNVFIFKTCHFTSSILVFLNWPTDRDTGNERKHTFF